MHNKLSESEINDGWILLFDGKSMNEWHIYNEKSDGTAWKIIDDCIALYPEVIIDNRTKGGGDLVSNEVYDQFHFKTDWKLDKGGNSGIFFWIQEDKHWEFTWQTGPEMQLLDNDNHKDGLIEKRKAGDMYDLISSTPGSLKPWGEWNTSEILVKNNNVAFLLNGKEILNTIIGDKAWTQRVSDSKFKDYLSFGLKKSGRIALQDHRDKVWFRNIKIKKL